MSTLLRVCFLFIMFPIALSRAQSNLLVQPIFGYERVFHSDPQPYWKTRNVFGARVIFGPQLLSLDAEYTQAKDNDDFGATSVEHESKKIKAGLRSTYNFNNVIGAYLRAGVQWKDETRTETTAGVPTETKIKSTDPYAGAGFVLAYAKNLALTADITAVFTEENPSGRDIEFQYTAGIVAKFGQ